MAGGGGWEVDLEMRNLPKDITQNHAHIRTYTWPHTHHRHYHGTLSKQQKTGHGATRLPPARPLGHGLRLCLPLSCRPPCVPHHPQSPNHCYNHDDASLLLRRRRGTRARAAAGAARGAGAGAAATGAGTPSSYLSQALGSVGAA